MMTDEQTTVTKQSVDTQNGEVIRKTSVATNEKVPGTLLAARVIYFIGGSLLVLLGIRFLLFLLGASRASGFVDFIYSLSGVFVAPFNGIFSEPTYGASRFDSATLVAMVVYGLVTLGLVKLVTLNRKDREEV